VSLGATAVSGLALALLHVLSPEFAPSWRMFMSSLQASGIVMSAQSQPLNALPAGVSGYVGRANRLLFLASYLWVALTARAVLRARTQARQ
jgi:hypothetical protein